MKKAAVALVIFLASACAGTRTSRFTSIKSKTSARHATRSADQPYRQRVYKNVELERDALAEHSDQVLNKVMAWRRHLHQHPELSKQEVQTAAFVAARLVELGLAVRVPFAETGVVAVLKGDLPGPVVALRADYDALPITELTGLPYASKERAEYQGQQVGVMHACGHDAHAAILLGAAAVLAAMRHELPGSVVFIFQPAEEGSPEAGNSGAERMIAAGALENPSVEAIFGLHLVTQYPTGTVAYLAGGAMASSDTFDIVVRGRQVHAATPWLGVDPILAAARIIVALQAIPSRQVDVRVPSVISIGIVRGGVRHNIIPESVFMQGTIRALAPDIQEELHRRVREVSERMAAASDARAEVNIRRGYPVTYNDPELTDRMLPTLKKSAQIVEGTPRTLSGGFAHYQRRVPGLYLWLGGRNPKVKENEVFPNHSPRFVIDEGALVVGVRMMAALAMDYLRLNVAAPERPGA